MKRKMKINIVLLELCAAERVFLFSSRLFLLQKKGRFEPAASRLQSVRATTAPRAQHVLMWFYRLVFEKTFL